MITINSSSIDHVEISVAAPFTVAELTDAGTSLRRMAGTPTLQHVLVLVESIGLPKPRALWEDIKLAPLINQIRWVALVTDIEWYAHLSELTSALWPGLTITHFEPTDVAAAREWLAAQHEH